MQLNFIIIAVLLIGIFENLNTQCKSFAKTKCVPQLSPYTFNGEVYAETFFDKDTGVIDLVFYAGQSYRLAMCIQPSIPKTYFELKDKDGITYFSSKSQSDNGQTFQYWDFKVNATTTLKLWVYSKADEKMVVPNVVPSGCVVIITGFKE